MAQIAPPPNTIRVKDDKRSSSPIVIARLIYQGSEDTEVYGGLDPSLTLLLHGLESDWIEEEMADDDDFRFLFYCCCCCLPCMHTQKKHKCATLCSAFEYLERGVTKYLCFAV